jgi:hypothetical protein
MTRRRMTKAELEQLLDRETAAVRGDLIREGLM